MHQKNAPLRRRREDGKTTTYEGQVCSPANNPMVNEVVGSRLNTAKKIRDAMGQGREGQVLNLRGGAALYVCSAVHE